MSTSGTMMIPNFALIGKLYKLFMFLVDPVIFSGCSHHNSPLQLGRHDLSGSLQ